MWYFRTFRSRRQQASGSRVPRQINGQGAGCQERRHLLNGNHILPRSGAHRKTQPSGCTHGLHNSAHLIESVMATLHGPLMGLVMVMMKKEIYLIYYYAYIFSYWIKMYCILSTKFYIKMCETIKSNLLQTASISNYIAYFPARAPHFPARPQAVEHSNQSSLLQQLWRERTEKFPPRNAAYFKGSPSIRRIHMAYTQYKYVIAWNTMENGQSHWSTGSQPKDESRVPKTKDIEAQKSKAPKEQDEQEENEDFVVSTRAEELIN